MLTKNHKTTEVIRDFFKSMVEAMHVDSWNFGLPVITREVHQHSIHRYILSREEAKLVGKIIALSLDTMTCTINTADRDALCELPFGGEVVVVCMNDWLQNTIALRSATSHIVALEVNLQSLRSDIERIGYERDQMVAANMELQERLSKLEDDGK